MVTDLATRYGSRTAGRKRLVTGVAAALAAVFLGWVAWVTFTEATPEVTSDLLSFDVVDDHTATATFRVSRRATEVEASCLLRAQARDHVTVGELNVTVGPGGEPERTLTETVRTERLATTVEMVGCVADGQSRRR